MLPTILPCLQGSGIELRCMGEGDAPSLFEIYGDPVVMQYTDEEPFENIGTVSLMLESVQTLLRRGESLEWAIVATESHTLIGTCGLHSFDEALTSAEVGCLLRQSAWGQGYMKNAINLLIRYAKDTLSLRHLIADVHPDNERAQQLFRALGFQHPSPAVWTLDLVDQP